MTATINADGNLEVVGSSSTPNNIFVETAHPWAVTGNINGVAFGPIDLSAPGKRVVVRGGTQKDLLQVAGPLPCEIYGVAGNDRVFGSAGGSVVFFPSGQTFADGGSGINALVGGSGVSVLKGAGGGLLLAGVTTMNYDQLRALADAFVVDPIGTDLAPLVASFTPHTGPGQAQLTGGSVRPTAFLCKTGDLVIGYDPSRGDQLFMV